jgi:hypothetical protein
MKSLACNVDISKKHAVRGDETKEINIIHQHFIKVHAHPSE